MQFTATHRYADVSPSKARDVVNLIRGKHVSDALQVLRATNKRASHMVDKVLRSAMANADQSLEANMERLTIKEAYVDGGPRRRKWRAQSKGRAAPIQSVTSHIHIVLDDSQ